MTSEVNPPSAAFQISYLLKDIQAGIITGVMAIPLSIGIALMSDYPIKVGLTTVAFACFIGWISSCFRPGNYVGAPGIAAGLAPVLAMGVATFGLDNMPFLIFLTASIQALIWAMGWQRYILLIVPHYLVEGLLAGIGLKIAIQFFTFTYEILPPFVSEEKFWNLHRLNICLMSIAGFVLFVFLYRKFRKTNPAIAYFALIFLGIGIARFVDVPMVSVRDIEISLGLPIPNFEGLWIWCSAILFALLLAVVDVIEQVMSNAAIEKIDPLERKCDSNNSLLAIWIANMGASFFGGMTNLDGLAKSTTNTLAGAHTKFSVLVIGSVVSIFVVYSEYLELFPKFALAIIMIFTGWKMIAGLVRVVAVGKYEFLLSVLCGGLVFQLGIFEGLLLALLLHAVISYIFYSQVHKMTIWEIFRKSPDKTRNLDLQVSEDLK